MTREALKFIMEKSYVLPQGKCILRLMVDQDERQGNSQIEQYGIELSCGELLLQAKRMTTNRYLAEKWITLLCEQQVSPNQFYAIVEDLLP